MIVELESIRFKNILSYGAKDIEHRFENGLTMISGRNGAGKSTFLEVLCYNWYGKPYRKIKLEALLNRENKKGLETETVFTVDKKDRYRIVRCMKPNTLKIFKNDVAFDMLSTKNLDQEEINKILGIDFKMFKQIVSLAVTYNKPFLTIDAAEKREIIESIFDVKIFGQMLSALKEKIKTLKMQYTVNKKSVEMGKETINQMRANISAVKKAISKFEEDKNTDITVAEENIAAVVRNTEEISVQIGKGKTDCESWAAKRGSLEVQLEGRKNELRSIGSVEANPVIIAMNADIAKLDEEITHATEEMATVEASSPSDSDTVYVEILKKIQTLNTVDAPALEAKMKGLCGDLDPKMKVKEYMAQNDTFSSTVAVCKNEIKTDVEYIKYLTENTVCQKCKHPIDDAFRKQEVDASYVRMDGNKAIIGTCEAEQTKISAAIAAIAEIKAEIDEKNNERNTLLSDKKNREAVLENEKKNTIKSIQAKISNITLQKSVKTAEIEKLRNERRVSVEKEIALLQSEIEKLTLNISNEEATITRLKTQIEQNEEQAVKFEARKKEIAERVSSFDLPALSKEFNEKIAEWQVLYTNNETMAEQLRIYDLTAQTLSEDGIKSFFFKRLVPILNAKINEYLYKFEIPVRVNFNEQMEEIITNVGRAGEQVSYFSYSEGEKKSIDIAILMSFIDITKIICSWNCNVLMIDELIDGNVDFPRLEKMIGCLRDFSTTGMIPCIYIISHRQIDEISQYFKRLIRVDKMDGYSKLSVKTI